MDKLNYVDRDIALLKELPGNARKHDQRNLEAIKASLQQFGQVQPIVITDDNIVLAGNGRLAAARDLGWKSLRCVVTSLKEYDAAAFAIADNRTAELADWDTRRLAETLVGIRKHEASLATAAGFREAEIAVLEAKLQGEKNLGPNEDSLVEKAKRTKIKAGDMFQLGEHVIACGSAEDPKLVRHLLSLVKPVTKHAYSGTIMVTDPPYGVEYEPNWRNTAGLSKTRKDAKIKNDDRADWSAAWALFPGAIAYVWHSGLHTVEVQLSLERAGFLLRAQIIWVKPALVIGRGHYNWQHEPALLVERPLDEQPENLEKLMHDPCFYAVRKGKTANWMGEPSASTVWNISSKNQDYATEHATQKPLECMMRPIRNHSLPGSVVYDPFAGSGTTIIGAEKLGRRCAAIDLEPGWVQASIDRWEALTGGKAKKLARLKT